MGRQVTAFTKAQACILGKSVCKAFVEQQKLNRQFTEPAHAHGLPVSRAFDRSLSWPVMPTFQTLGEIEGDFGGIDAESCESDVSLSEIASNEAEDHAQHLADSPITTAILSAVKRCSSSLAVATARGSGLIAVSTELANITGYSCDDILSFGAADCPALSHCLVQEQVQSQAYRHAVETGSEFVSVFASRKRSGAIFLNLVHVRGLCVAESENPEEEDLWLLLMAFADVSGLDRQRIPSSHGARLDKLASRIQKHVHKQINLHGLGNMFGPGGQGGLQLMPMFRWKPGPSVNFVSETLDGLAQSPDVTGILCASNSKTSPRDGRSKPESTMRQEADSTSQKPSLAHDPPEPEGTKENVTDPTLEKPWFRDESEPEGAAKNEIVQRSPADKLGSPGWLSFAVIAATVGVVAFFRCRRST